MCTVVLFVPEHVFVGEAKEKQRDGKTDRKDEKREKQNSFRVAHGVFSKMFSVHYKVIHKPDLRLGSTPLEDSFSPV